MSLLPNCREMSRVMSDARDTGKPLGFGARLHLLICDVCSRLLRQLAVLGDSVRATPASGPALSNEAKERLRRALKD